MRLGQLSSSSRPKLAVSSSQRRFHLAIAHHGAPSAWSAPTKDDPVQRKPNKKRR